MSAYLQKTISLLYSDYMNTPHKLPVGILECKRKSTAIAVPPWMAVVPRSSDVSAEPRLVVKTIHGRIVLTILPDAPTV